MKRRVARLSLAAVLLATVIFADAAAAANALGEDDLDRASAFQDKVLAKQGNFNDATTGAIPHEYDYDCLDRMSLIVSKLQNDSQGVFLLVGLSTLMMHRDDELSVNKMLASLLRSQQKFAERMTASLNQIRGSCARSAVTNSFAAEFISLIEEGVQMRARLLKKIGG